MLKNLITSIILFCCIKSFAQDATQLNVLYEVNYIRDLSLPQQPLTDSLMLSLGKETSRFVSQKTFKNNTKELIAARKKQQEQMASVGSSTIVNATGMPVLSIKNSGAIVNEEILQDKKNATLTQTGRLGLKTYFYTTSIPEIKWKLQSEKKQVLGYDCQKATGDYAGRTYEAWFTTALPYTFGPWKLQGLPGLILEAKDSKGEITFFAKEILKNEDPEELVIPYLKADYAVEVKEKEYKQTMKMLVEDPEAITAAQYPNTKVRIRNIDDTKNTAVIKVKKYNPVELR